MNQVLSTSLAGSSKDDFLLVKGIRIVRNNRGVLLVGFDDGGTSLTAGNDFGLASLGRVTGALGATSMLAAGTLLGGRKGGVALVTGSSDAHADRLVNTEDGVVGRSGLEFGNVDIKSITLAEFLGTLLNQLAPRHLGNALQAFMLGPSSRLLVLGHGSLAASLLVTAHIRFGSLSSREVGPDEALLIYERHLDRDRTSSWEFLLPWLGPLAERYRQSTGV